MGSHQVKPSRSLGNLHLHNGYAKDSDFTAHRRSTGHKFDQKGSDKREPRKHKVQYDTANANGNAKLNRRVVGKELRKPFEDETVDGWPKWLVDNVPREALAGLVPKSAESYIMINKVSFCLFPPSFFFLFF